MTPHYLSQLNASNEGKQIPPKSDEAPVSPTEKLVREAVKKLTENAEEIKKLRELIEKKDLKEERK